MGVSKNRGIPKWMVYNEKPYEQMDDLGVPLFLETPIYLKPGVYSSYLIYWLAWELGSKCIGNWKIRDCYSAVWCCHVHAGAPPACIWDESILGIHVSNKESRNMLGVRPIIYKYIYI